mgnify:CR=1 FL=1
MTEHCAGCADAKEKAARLREIIAKYKDTQGALIPVLHEAQEVYGYLPLEVQREISLGLNIPPCGSLWRCQLLHAVFH